MSSALVHLSPSLLPPCSSEPPSSPRQIPAAAPNCSSCLLAAFQDPDSKVTFQNAKHIMSLPGRLGSKPALTLPSSRTLLPCSLHSGLMGFCQSLGTLLPHLFSLPPCTTPHLVNPGSSFIPPTSDPEGSGSCPSSPCHLLSLPSLKGRGCNRKRVRESDK